MLTILWLLVIKCSVYGTYLHLQTIGSWFQEFSDEQKNLLLLQLLVGKLFISVFALFFIVYIKSLCILKFINCMK